MVVLSAILPTAIAQHWFSPNVEDEVNLDSRGHASSAFTRTSAEPGAAAGR
ncbi:MAG: hypothetical protein ACR2HD_10110 [Solirubrobacteraceae bacterium]